MYKRQGSFNWDGGDPYSNVPKAISGEFPPEPGLNNTTFKGWASQRGECKETAYGCFVTRVTPAQIMDYIEYCYGSVPMYNDPDKMLMWEGRPYLVDRLDAIKRLVSELDETKLYALIGTEF